MAAGLLGELNGTSVSGPDLRAFLADRLKVYLRERARGTISSTPSSPYRVRTIFL